MKSFKVIGNPTIMVGTDVRAAIDKLAEDIQKEGGHTKVTNFHFNGEYKVVNKTKDR